MTSALHTLAAFLLSLVGYAAGTVLLSADPDRRPAGWEVTLAAAAGLVAAVAGPAAFGAWLALPSSVAGGVAVGGLGALAVRLAVSRRDERPSLAGAAAPRDEDDVGSARRFLVRLGAFQGQLLMAILYFVLLAPFAAVSRLTSDPLHLDEAEASYWRDRTDDGSGEPSRDLRRQG